MGYRIIICVFFCLGVAAESDAQGRYSIDVKNKNNRDLPIAYIISQTGMQIKEAKEWRKNNRLERKISRKTERRFYHIQTQEVKKRMKRSEKKAENYNRGKVPLRVKLKRLMSNG